MPRKDRLDAPNTWNYAIIPGIEKRPIVDDDEDRKRVLRAGDFVERT